MGAFQLPDDITALVEGRVREGKATSAAAFLEEAVRRLVDDESDEGDEMSSLAHAGAADFAAGRYTKIASAEDGRQLQERILFRLQERLAQGK